MHVLDKATVSFVKIIRRDFVRVVKPTGCRVRPSRVVSSFIINAVRVLIVKLGSLVYGAPTAELVSLTLRAVGLVERVGCAVGGRLSMSIGSFMLGERSHVHCYSWSIKTLVPIVLGSLVEDALFLAAVILVGCRVTDAPGRPLLSYL